MYKFLIIYFSFFVTNYLYAVDNKNAQVTLVENIVKKTLNSDSQWVQTKKGDFLKKGQKVRTYAKSRAEIEIQNLSVIRLAPKTTLSIDKLYEETKDKKLESELAVEEGEIWSNTMKLNDDLEFKVNTDVAGMAIKGTIFRVAKKENGNTQLKVYQGAVAVRNLTANVRRYEVSKPKEISGPREVSLKEWLEIVKNMQMIEISPDGMILVKRNFDLSEPDENTEWVKWNRQRDSLLIIQRKKHKK